MFFLSSVRNVFFNGEEEVEDVKEERERPPAQLASILFKGTSRLTDYLFVEKNLLISSLTLLKQKNLLFTSNERKLNAENTHHR